MNTWGKVEVLEAALIHAYDPEFQRHHVARIEKQIGKYGFAKEVVAHLLKAKKRIVNCFQHTPALRRSADLYRGYQIAVDEEKQRPEAQNITMKC